MNLTLFFNLGIIDTETKEALEPYTGSAIFERRKNYEEWYISISGLEVVNVDLEDLMYLSGYMEVSIKGNSIYFNEL